MQTDETIYKYHVENLRKVSFAITCIERSLRQSIALRKKDEEESFLRILTLMVGMWAESRLKKILFEKGGFSQQERQIIEVIENQIERWKMTIKLSFCRHLSVPLLDILKDTHHLKYQQRITNKIIENIDSILKAKLSGDDLIRYESIIETITEELIGAIELRNRMAHGQFHFILNSNGNDLVADKMSVMSAENNLSLQNKLKLLDALGALVHDLVVTKKTFVNDFQNHYREIQNKKQNILNLNATSYASYRLGLEEKSNKRKQAIKKGLL